MRMLSNCYMAIGLVLLGGCDNPEHWKFEEQVLLNTGQTIVIARDAKRNNVWPHTTEDGYQSVVEELVTYPSYGIDWQRTVRGPILSIDLVNGVPYVATRGINNNGDSNQRPVYCDAHPDALNMTFWRLEQGHWVPVEQTPQLGRQMTLNILPVNYWESKPKTPSIADKTRQAEYHLGFTYDYGHPQSLYAAAQLSRALWSCKRF